jgi:7,8-dihydro-6-hydroxymethylpterin dimethyltransferase
MPELPVPTISLCPHCLRRIKAQRVIDGNSVYLVKNCPQHGDLDRVLLWNNNPVHYREWSRSEIQSSAAAPDLSSGNCPYSCGICQNHSQKTCSAIIEVTSRCNLACSVCFAASGKDDLPDPNLDLLSDMLQHLFEQCGPCPIQLSGGEPTLRDDLDRIVSTARRLGFDHIQINTNGIRLAQDADYAQRLKDAGASVVFLQFDGVTDDVYQSIRGVRLLDTKLKAIARCAELKLGVILVPTLIRNVNDNQIGAIIRFAKQWMPVVKGVHFQPMTYLGRYPADPCNEDRILIPDVLAAIEYQTEGELKVANFLPPG